MVASRRLLTAFLVALGTFGLLLAGTGAANAQDGAGGLDGTFTVAPSRPGDRVVYALHLVRIEEGEKGGWAYDAGARLEIERLGDRVVPVDGLPQVVSSFASTWTTRDIDWGDWLFAWQMEAAMAEFNQAAGEMPEFEGNAQSEDDWGDWGEAMSQWGESLGDAFANLFGLDPRIQGEPWHVAHIDGRERVIATTRPGSDPDLPGGRLAADLGLAPQTTVVTTPGPSTAPCGFRSSLQGTVVKLAQAVRVPGNCPPAGGHFGNAPDNLTSDRFVAVGHDIVQGRPAVVFAHEDGADNLRLWYAEDTAYPVRMVVPVLVYKDYYVHLLYEMTESTQGTLQPAQAPSPLGLAPLTRAGPDATGVETPFSLAHALQAAITDKEYKGAADFTTSHPDAAIESARFLRLRDDSNLVQERWTFTLVSGGDALHVTATRGAPYEGPTEPGTTPGQVPPVPPGAWGALPAEGRAIIDDGVVVTGTEGSSGGRVTPEQMPGAMPRVADLLSLWRSDGAGGGTPAWSYEVRPDGATWLAAGQAEAFTTGTGTPDEEDDETMLAYSFYGVGPDGSFLFSEESPTRDGYDVPVAEDPDAMANANPENDDGFSRPSSFALAALGYWSFPETKTTATVTAAAGLLGLIAYALMPAKMGALGLFSRIGSDEVLEHPLRSQIANLVEAEPGIHFQELVRRLDAGRGTMEHHLRKLVAADVVSAQASQGFTCYFPKGKIDRHLMAAAPVLKSEGARQVLQCIQEQPGRPAQDVAAAVGLTPSTVNYHLKRLAQSGLVSSQRSGRFILLTPTPLGTQALGAWGRT